MTALQPGQFILDHNYGVLSTHSQSETGYPFGSVTPYIVSDGGLAIYISHLAEHTKNIQANPKVSLTIFDITNTNNLNANPRITCLANAYPAGNQQTLREQYLNRFPDAAIVLDLPGFQFYILSLIKVRLVAGFGQVKWIDKEQLAL